MNLVLFTLWRVKNYGAEMQTYATTKILKELGHEVTVINLKKKNHSSLKGLCYKLLTNFTLENLKFKYFWKKFIPSSKIFSTTEEIKNFIQDKSLIVGSDQVWNPTITKDFWEIYFLPFSNKCKISYASSFGSNEWTIDQNITKKVRSHLKQFSSISSREQTGVNILKENFNLNAENVLDPTLLHESYPEITGSISLKKHLVYYPLSINNEAESFCKQLAKQLKLTYKNANKIYLFRSIVINRPSVKSWLKNIAEGEFIITPSFHGMTMSLIYHKQFIIIDLHQSKRSCRIIDLLRLLELEDRYFTSYEEIITKEPWKRPIDYEKVDKLLKRQREKSISYLKESIF